MAKADVARIAAAYSFIGQAAVQGPARWIPRAWQTKLGSLAGVPEAFITTQQITRAELCASEPDRLSHEMSNVASLSPPRPGATVDQREARGESTRC